MSKPEYKPIPNIDVVHGTIRVSPNYLEVSSAKQKKPEDQIFIHVGNGTAVKQASSYHNITLSTAEARQFALNLIDAIEMVEENVGK
jgi:hypothetical protein